MANYIREWNNMARCYNPFGCPFKAAHQGTTERRCTLEEDCVSKDDVARVIPYFSTLSVTTGAPNLKPGASLP